MVLWKRIHNKRLSNRFRTLLNVSFANFPSLPLEKTVNISEGGVFVKTEVAPPLGSRVILSIHLFGKERLETEASAVQIVTAKQAKGRSYPPGVGLSFAPASPHFRQRLAELLAELNRVPPRVLVVDDDEDFRIGLADALQSLGMSVETSGSGEEALRTVIDRLFDLDVVLLDLRMPGMGGRGFLDRVRRLGGELDLPIIVLSGADIRDVSDLRGSSGANQVLPKGRSPEVIIQSIRQVLGRPLAAGLSQRPQT